MTPSLRPCVLAALLCLASETALAQPARIGELSESPVALEVLGHRDQGPPDRVPSSDCEGDPIWNDMANGLLAGALASTLARYYCEAGQKIRAARCP